MQTARTGTPESKFMSKYVRALCVPLAILIALGIYRLGICLSVEPGACIAMGFLAFFGSAIGLMLIDHL
jgi:hypothetical protein